MRYENFDIVVIGGGPAGIAASKTASESNKKVLLIEREDKLGGILKQCIHDGFGLTRYQKKLSGPEYAYNEIQTLKNTNVVIYLLSFVSRIDKEEDGSFVLHVVTSHGMVIVHCEKIIFATGARERTSKQVFITGTNPSGVLTAGQAQYYINILGKMPGKNFVILGSGDIGLIMARRITLEGGKVIGVFEAKPTPSGLQRNIAQCLNDFNIPLTLSTTVSRVFGKDRLEKVEIVNLDKNNKPIKGTEKIIDCDCLILSVGLIPENELLETLNAKMSNFSKGPEVDQNLLTSVSNVYCCGNSLHINDLVDYVSESGMIAGKSACKENPKERKLVNIQMDEHFLYVVPSLINTNCDNKNITIFFRSKENYTNKLFKILINGKECLKKPFISLKPPEMEKINLNIDYDMKSIETIELVLEDR